MATTLFAQMDATFFGGRVARIEDGATVHLVAIPAGVPAWRALLDEEYAITFGNADPEVDEFFEVGRRL